jgi:hypothetical protein
MARTYMSKIPSWGSCETPYCGSFDKFFCVKCKHYVVDCRCQPGFCSCGTDRYWAAIGERPMLRQRLEEDMRV